MITTHPDNIIKPMRLLNKGTQVTASNLGASYAIFGDAPKGAKMAKISVATAGVSICPPWDGKAQTATATYGHVYPVGTHDVPFGDLDPKVFTAILQSGSPTVFVTYWGN